jgi:hypothetical protein
VGAKNLIRNVEQGHSPEWTWTQAKLTEQLDALVQATEAPPDAAQVIDFPARNGLPRNTNGAQIQSQAR